MSVTTENAPVQGQTTLQENRVGEGVYASLFEKINLAPASRLGDINDFLDDAALSEAPAAERLTAAMQVFMERIRQSGQRVEKLDKTLIDHHIAELDFQISRQLDAVMHHQEFQQVESKTLPNELKGSWISGPTLTSGSGWNNACEESEVEFSLSEDNSSIDPVLGYTGHAAPWLAITLANADVEQRGPQVIAAQPAVDKDDIWIAVITKEEVRKETPKND